VLSPPSARPIIAWRVKRAGGWRLNPVIEHKGVP
jgi:hypothetical protein